NVQSKAVEFLKGLSKRLHVHDFDDLVAGCSFPPHRVGEEPLVFKFILQADVHTAHSVVVPQRKLLDCQEDNSYRTRWRAREKGDHLVEYGWGYVGEHLGVESLP